MLGTRDFLSQFCFTVLLTGSSSDRISVTIQHKKRENVTDGPLHFSTIPLYMRFSHESSHYLDNSRWRVLPCCGIMAKAPEAVSLEFPTLKLMDYRQIGI